MPFLCGQIGVNLEADAEAMIEEVLARSAPDTAVINQAEADREGIQRQHVFRKLSDVTVGGTVAARAAEPGTVIDSLTQHPEVDAVMSAVQAILDSIRRRRATSRRDASRSSSSRVSPITCGSRR